MVGRMTRSRLRISPGCEIPASKIASVVRSSISQTERGTPICELYDLGERVIR